MMHRKERDTNKKIAEIQDLPINVVNNVLYSKYLTGAHDDDF